MTDIGGWGKGCIILQSFIKTIPTNSMSIEGGNYEKTRIQDPNEAHEEANMLRVEAGDAPKAEDYDKALAYLDELQGKAEKGSPSKLDSLLAGLIEGTVGAMDLVALALLPGAKLLAGGGRTSKEEIQRSLMERYEQMGENIDFMKSEMNEARMNEARRTLEEWKERAESE
jgi:hypothetical protein